MDSLQNKTVIHIEDYKKWLVDNCSTDYQINYWYEQADDFLHYVIEARAKEWNLKPKEAFERMLLETECSSYNYEPKSIRTEILIGEVNKTLKRRAELSELKNDMKKTNIEMIEIGINFLNALIESEQTIKYNETFQSLICTLKKSKEIHNESNP